MDGGMYQRNTSLIVIPKPTLDIRGAIILIPILGLHRPPSAINRHHTEGLHKLNLAFHYTVMWVRRAAAHSAVLCPPQGSPVGPLPRQQLWCTPHRLPFTRSSPRGFEEARRALLICNSWPTASGPTEGSTTVSAVREVWGSRA